jgi:hypothetical protein
MKTKRGKSEKEKPFSKEAFNKRFGISPEMSKTMDAIEAEATKNGSLFSISLGKVAEIMKEQKSRNKTS